MTLSKRAFIGQTACCTKACKTLATILSQTPANGSTVSTGVGANTATVLVNRLRKLVSFTLTNTSGAAIAGSVSPAIGAMNTSFTFTPGGTVNTHVTATLVLADKRGRCEQTISWIWTAEIS